MTKSSLSGYQGGPLLIAHNGIAVAFKKSVDDFREDFRFFRFSKFKGCQHFPIVDIFSVDVFLLPTIFCRLFHCRQFQTASQFKQRVFVRIVFDRKVKQ